jgi:hypothetical protein
MDLVNLSQSMHFCPVRFLEEHAIFATSTDRVQDMRGFFRGILFIILESRSIMMMVWGSTNLFFATSRNRFILILFVFTGGWHCN